MRGLLDDPHRRHLLLTLLVGAGLAAYLTGSIRSVYGFDLAMLLALGGGFPIYFGAASALTRRKMSADLAVSLAAFAALYVGYVKADPEMYAVAAEVILIMLIGEALEHFAVDRGPLGPRGRLADGGVKIVADGTPLYRDRGKNFLPHRQEVLANKFQETGAECLH